MQHGPPSPPIVAEISGPPDDLPAVGQSKWGCWAAMAVGGGFLFLCVCFIAATVWVFSAANRRRDESEQAAVTALQQDGKVERIGTAFREPSIQVTADEHRAIAEFIEQVMYTGASEDTQDLLALVSIDGFIKQMERSGESKPLTTVERRWIRNNFEQVTWGPESYEQHHIVSIEELNEREVIVYLHAWDVPENVSQHRWWLIRSGGRVARQRLGVGLLRDQ